MKACEDELYQVIRIFIEESIRYFDNILDMNLFDQLFPAIAQLSVKEKKGSGDIITELSNLIYKEESNRAAKQSINHACMALPFRYYWILWKSTGMRPYRCTP